MKYRILLTLVAAAMLLAATAQDLERFVGINPKHTDVSQPMQQLIEQDMAARGAKQKVLPIKKYILGDNHLWTNGFDVFETYYDGDCHEVGINPRPFDNSEVKFNDPITALAYRKGKVVHTNGGNTSYSVERYGNHTMLVERNAKGTPVAAYYNIATSEEVYQFLWTLPTQCLLAGNYATPTGHHAVFGPKMAFYEGNSYDVDPGFYSFRYAMDFSSFDILYGSGRVSHGNPNSPNYKAHMPGGGGAGAIMGPMIWNLTLTADGLKVHVVDDQEFVDHSPRVEDNALLTLVQTPFEGIPGKWAVASVMPLTHQMLRLFPKEVLKLMRGEIYARHGDTFSDPDTQRYFDAQPWYKKGSGKVILTDIERFNYALIKHIEQTK